MEKLALIPENSSYAVAKGVSVLQTKLDGGASRYRRSQLGATSTVDVVFQLGMQEYDYLEAFYRTATEQGSLPFTIDLILGYSILKEYKCYFTQGGSPKLTGQKGQTYYCSAQLEVYPDADDAANDSSLIFLVNTFGFEWPYYEDLFDTLINVEFPQDLVNS